MEWTTVIFSAAVALPTAAFFKYGGTIILEKMFSKRFLRALIHVIKNDMRDEITSKIEFTVRETVLKALHSGEIVIEVVEGRERQFVKIRRPDHVSPTRE